ncbi:MAG: hypothetical protein ACXACU_06410 [Candidatus Hodarchaeales archaeon]|jgi:hypothetical protein
MNPVENVRRLPWKSYIRKNAPKIVFFLIITILVVYSISLSDGIDLNTLENNDSTQFISLIVVSSFTFLLLLAGILKTFVLDSAYSLGLADDDGKYKKFQAVSFSLLAILFVSCAYFLIDVALQDAFLQLGPVIVFQSVLTLFELEIPGFTDLTGREFYQTARNILFEAVALLIIIYLILAIIIQVTRTGRKRLLGRLSIEKREEKDEIKEDVSVYKIILFIILPPLNYFLLINTIDVTPLIFAPVAFFVLISSLWWLYQCGKAAVSVIWKGARITPFLTSVNFLLVIPPILIFLILPALLQALLDLIPMISEGTTPITLEMILSTLGTNIIAFDKIIFFDFVILTSIATAVIGFAEGASLFAILRALKDGINFNRSGDIVLEQAPKISVWTKYVALLGIWIGVFLNTLGALWESLKEVLLLNLPPFPFKLSFELIISLKDFLQSLVPEFFPIILPMLLLIIPLYFILSASFKFLSVTVVTPRIEDLQTFVVIVATTFILIIIQILADLWTIEEIQDAPLRILAEGLFFSQMVEILQIIEAGCFYIGLIVMFYVILARKFRILKINKN